MSTDAYLDAKAEFERASVEVRATAAALAQISSTLQNNPFRFIFSNTSGPGLPMEAAMGNGAVSFDGKQWPNAENINALLARLHEAKAKMENAWRAVPRERQSGLVAPATLRQR